MEEEGHGEEEETALNLSICSPLNSWNSKTMEIFEVDLALCHGCVHTGTMAECYGLVWIFPTGSCVQNTWILAGGGEVLEVCGK